MELKDIQKSITEMSDEEIRNQLSGIRANRRVSKRPPTATKAPSAKADGSNISTESLMKSINKDQAAMLLALMAKGGSK